MHVNEILKNTAAFAWLTFTVYKVDVLIAEGTFELLNVLPDKTEMKNLRKNISKL